jgi:hypothetical protein
MNGFFPRRGAAVTLTTFTGTEAAIPQLRRALALSLVNRLNALPSLILRMTRGDDLLVEHNGKMLIDMAGRELAEGGGSGRAQALRAAGSTVNATVSVPHRSSGVIHLRKRRGIRPGGSRVGARRPSVPCAGSTWQQSPGQPSDM